jgi:hypothetical protein
VPPLRLLVHGLRAARPRQLAARALRPARRRRFPAGRPARVRPLPENEALWRSEAFAPLGALPESGSRLEEFHAHYGEDVLEAARRGEDAATPAAAWIAANPPQPGDAWHPYPLSTRAANWIAALTLQPALASIVAGSLARQLAYLARNVEDDVLGNHVVRNAKALVLGGESLGDPALRRRGLALLARELPEQVLPDGGHYERSPAYHRLVLRDLLELRPFADVDAEVERMTRFAAASSRPDGAPALFNDGGLDVAPRLELPDASDGLSTFPDTGYAFVRKPGLWLAFDCGPPAPPFLPAHAHADALSFQLWLDGRPVVVDPGTSTYEADPDRDRDRGTAAHSTVAVDGDQFELWRTFRSGPLPDVRLLEATPTRLVGEVRLRSGVVHRRTIELGPDAIDVEDRLDGIGVHHVKSSLPGLSNATARGPLAVREETRTVAERFGETTRVPAVVQEGTLELPATIGWRIARLQ